MSELSVTDIRPFLRYIHEIELIDKYTSHLQTAFDHRIFYCLKGDYVIEAAGERYALKEDSLLFVPAGTPYHLLPTASPVRLAGLNFDFTQASASLDQPIAPAFSPREFSPAALTENVFFREPEALNHPLLLNAQAHFRSDIEAMSEEYRAKRLYYVQRNNALLASLLLSLARQAAAGFQRPEQTAAEQVIAYLQANYRRALSNETIGRELNFHPNYLSRVLLRATGQTLHQYLLSLRLTQALDLLQSTSLTVTEIAQETGFGDVRQFSRYFTRKTGQTPGRFRK